MQSMSPATAIYVTPPSVSNALPHITHTTSTTNHHKPLSTPNWTMQLPFAKHSPTVAVQRKDDKSEPNGTKKAQEKRKYYINKKHTKYNKNKCTALKTVQLPHTLSYTAHIHTHLGVSAAV